MADPIIREVENASDIARNRKKDPDAVEVLGLIDKEKNSKTPMENDKNAEQTETAKQLEKKVDYFSPYIFLGEVEDAELAADSPEKKRRKKREEKRGFGWLRTHSMVLFLCGFALFFSRLKQHTPQVATEKKDGKKSEKALDAVETKKKNHAVAERTLFIDFPPTETSSWGYLTRLIPQQDDGEIEPEETFQNKIKRLVKRYTSTPQQKERLATVSFHVVSMVTIILLSLRVGYASMHFPLFLGVGVCVLGLAAVVGDEYLVWNACPADTDIADRKKWDCFVPFVMHWILTTAKWIAPMIALFFLGHFLDRIPAMKETELTVRATFERSGLPLNAILTTLGIVLWTVNALWAAVYGPEQANNFIKKPNANADDGNLTSALSQYGWAELALMVQMSAYASVAYRGYSQEQFRLRNRQERQALVDAEKKNQ